MSPLVSPTWHGNSVTHWVTHASQTKPVMKHFIQLIFRSTQALKNPCTLPCTGLSTPLHPPPALGGPGTVPAAPGCTRARASTCSSFTCSNTRHSPQDAVAKTVAQPLPRGGRKTQLGTEDGCRGAKTATLTSPTPRGQKGSTCSHPHGVHGIAMGSSEEGEAQSQTQRHLTQSRADQCTQAAQEFYHLKTTPGRFLLVSPTVYQTPGQATPPGQQSTGEPALLWLPGGLGQWAFVHPTYKMPAAPS